MKWIYGKQDFKTIERSEENCYLMTNELGGFSSLTMAGAVARNDHSFFMACIKAPNCRFNVIHRLKEQIDDLIISTQEFADGTKEEGYRYLTSFSYEDTPVWLFQADGVEIRKEAALDPEKNIVAVKYEIENRRKKTCSFRVKPFFQFAPKGKDMGEEEQICLDGNQIRSGTMCLDFWTNGDSLPIPKEKETYFYRYDICDGRRPQGTAVSVHEVTCTVDPQEDRTLEIVYRLLDELPRGELTDTAHDTADRVIGCVRAFRDRWQAGRTWKSEVAKALARSASVFVTKRDSTGGKTILAGYPFFEDWGRDTMIALPGICLATRQYEAAKSILRTFAVNERKGLMPNLFPEGDREPMYNTADAALLFINCIYLYYEKTQDRPFAEEMFPVMKRIIAAYSEGTDYGISMDRDGLIKAGKELDQVTWMDVRIGDILPTPRHGKPVEINAYWYNALMIMDFFARALGQKEKQYRQMAEKVKQAFRKEFWMAESHCLKDVVSGELADTQIRCNQIWAISLPFTMLDTEMEKQVVETVFEKLYTPYGLRTLEKTDPDFHPFYGGDVMERDLAYHQGTVWPFPMGAYYLAYLKVNNYSVKAKEKVKNQLEVIKCAMREGCVGQLPEIYDGDNPTSSKGCFAQAWSVGEILRVYENLEK